jgi:heptose-I-phosphate ethanolaminephosphotransferase
MKTLKRVGHWLLRPFIDNGVFFVSMYVLGVLCAVLTLPDTKGAKLYDNLWLELFLDTYVACVVLSLIPRKIRVWVRRLLYVVLYSVAITDVFCFWKFGTTINPSMLLLVGETDSREAGEFFRTYLNFDVLLSPIGWLVALMAAHAVIALRKKLCRLFKLNYSQLVKPFFIKVSALSGRYRLVPVSAVAVVVLLVWSVCSSWQNKRGMTRLMTAPTIGEVEHILTEPDHGEFYLPVYRLAFSIYSNELASKQVGRCIAASNAAKVDSCSYRSPEHRADYRRELQPFPLPALRLRRQGHAASAQARAPRTADEVRRRGIVLEPDELRV